MYLHKEDKQSYQSLIKTEMFSSIIGYKYYFPYDIAGQKAGR